MSDLLARVQHAAQRRTRSQQAFVAAVVRAREVHSWSELARAAGLSPSGVRKIVQEHDKREENGNP